MTAKELQQQYLDSLEPKVEKPKGRDISTISDAYIRHVRSQASILEEHLSKEQGVYYIEHALRDHPDILEAELKLFDK